ncbi:hypothetical protein PINS_up005040 [Pythium insidiosum]|nr:hypothetical protein PINS_up005040 [Pythium insidiosum]
MADAVPSDNVPRDVPAVEAAQSSAPVGPHNFEKLRLLGAGSTGRVYLVRSVGLGPEAFYAMKVVSKRELERRNRVQRILTERDLLMKTNHPFIVTLHYSFETTDYFYLILQYCAGGELFSFLRRREDHCIPENYARFYAAEVLVALEYLHMLGIIYRDLKPENILIHESGHIVLSDFDLAYQVKPLAQAVASAKPSMSQRSSIVTRSASYSSLVEANTPPQLRGSRKTSRSSKIPTPTPRTRSKSPRRLMPPLSPTLSTTDRILGKALPLQRRAKLLDVPLETSDRAERVRGCGRLLVPRALFRRLSSPCIPFTLRRETLPIVDTESHMELAEKRTSFVGTHEYVAPEVIAEEGYVGSVDWWAFGILLYEMVFGVTPFRGETQTQTLENIIDICEDITFPEPSKTEASKTGDGTSSAPVVSEACKDLIRRLLDKTVSKRMQNPLHIKSHPFFADVVWPLIRHERPPTVPEMLHVSVEPPLSPAELTDFDNEVPFHRALGGASRSSAALSTKLKATESSSVPSPVQPSSPSLSPTRSNTTTSPTHGFAYAAHQHRGQFWASNEAHRTLSVKLSQLDLQLALEDQSIKAGKDIDDSDSEDEVELRLVEDVEITVK